MTKNKLIAWISVAVVATAVSSFALPRAASADTLNENLPDPNPCTQVVGTTGPFGSLSICQYADAPYFNASGGNNQSLAPCTGGTIFPYALLAQVVNADNKTFPVQNGVSWTLSSNIIGKVKLFGTSYDSNGNPVFVEGNPVTTLTGDIDGIAQVAIETLDPAKTITADIPFTVTASMGGYGSVTFHEILKACDNNQVPVGALGGLGMAGITGGTLFVTQRRRARRRSRNQDPTTAII